MDPDFASGRCLCGAVSFTTRFPTKWVAHCHCTRCRRAHGAAFVTWVGVEQVRASIGDPGGKLRWFRSADGAERGFCSVCGSSMFFRSPARWPGELHIARALFNDPLDREPQAHAYYDTHVEWVSLADSLPRKSDPESTA